MDKHFYHGQMQSKSQHLGRVFNTRRGCLYAINNVTVQYSKAVQLLGSLPQAAAFVYLANNSKTSKNIDCLMARTALPCLLH